MDKDDYDKPTFFQDGYEYQYSENADESDNPTYFNDNNLDDFKDEYENSQDSFELPKKAGTRKSLSRILGKLLVSQLCLLIVLWIVSEAPWNKLVNEWIAGIWTVLALIAIGNIFLFLVLEFANSRKIIVLDRLKKLVETLNESDRDDIRQEFCNAIRYHYKSTSSMRDFVTAVNDKEQVGELTNAEFGSWLRDEALIERDKQARDLINKHSVTSGLLIALSLNPKLDMLTALWRSIALILRIAEIYDVHGGLFTRWRLIAYVSSGVVFTGSVQYLMNANMTTHLAAGPARFVGQHLGNKEIIEQGLQGVGLGLFMTRIGLSTMRVCRPVPLSSMAYERLFESVRKNIRYRLEQRNMNINDH